MKAVKCGMRGILCIPKHIEYDEFKKLVGDNPAVIKFKQNDYWKNEATDDNYHGIGYAHGGFFEPWLGNHGETWEEVRGGKNNTALFSTNEGGCYFEIQE